MPPQLLNRAADYDLPQRVFSNWKPTDGRREIVRALTDPERYLVEQRRDELRIGLQPFQPEESDRVEIALNALFSGFRSMRQMDTAGSAIVQVTMAVLREFPAWAIERACVKIARNEAGLDPTWPPNDAQIHAVVADIVNPYREALRTAESLLAAPIERPQLAPPRKTYEQIRAELAERGFYIGDGRIKPGENADVFCTRYGVSREAYDAIPDLPKDHEYWAGMRRNVSRET